MNCPECNADISDKAKVCPNCGFTLKKTPIVEVHFDKNARNTFSNIKKRKGLVAAFIVCVIGIGVFLYLFTRCEVAGCYNPKYKGSHYCAMHAIEYDNHLYSNSYSFDMYDNELNKNAIDLTISNVEVYSKRYCEGTITNMGNVSYRFVKVKGNFKDSSGQTVEIGSSYAVGSEGLSPGESTTFTIHCTENRNIQNCSVEVYDYDS